jgi:hypothetical protein
MSRSDAWAPSAQEETKVSTVHNTVDVDVGTAVWAWAPSAKQQTKVSTVHNAIVVLVGRAC